jgi:hypothetical protein
LARHQSFRTCNHVVLNHLLARIISSSGFGHFIVSDSKEIMISLLQHIQSIYIKAGNSKFIIWSLLRQLLGNLKIELSTILYFPFIHFFSVGE